MRRQKRGKMVPGYVPSWTREEVKEERNKFWIKRRKWWRNREGRPGDARKRKDNGEWWKERMKGWGRNRKGRGKRMLKW